LPQEVGTKMNRLDWFSTGPVVDDTGCSFSSRRNLAAAYGTRDIPSRGPLNFHLFVAHIFRDRSDDFLRLEPAAWAAPWLAIPKFRLCREFDVVVQLLRL